MKKVMKMIDIYNEINNIENDDKHIENKEKNVEIVNLKGLGDDF